MKRFLDGQISYDEYSEWSLAIDRKYVPFYVIVLRTMGDLLLLCAGDGIQRGFMKRMPYRP